MMKSFGGSGRITGSIVVDGLRAPRSRVRVAIQKHYHFKISSSDPAIVKQVAWDVR